MLLFNIIKLLLLFALVKWLLRAFTDANAWGRRNRPRRAVPDVMCRCLGRMLAIIAKADGHISEREVNAASKCLRSLYLTEAEYQKCASAFNSVHSASPAMIRQCAAEFANVATSETCLLLYELLWIVAAADGRLAESEAALLRAAAQPLGLNASHYHYFRRRYSSGEAQEDGGAGPSDAGRASAGGGLSDLDRAYARLGCSPSDSDDTIKSAYRRLAMRYHPDRLKAEGVPDSMIAMANKSMAEINEAWETVKRSRK